MIAAISVVAGLAAFFGLALGFAARRAAVDVRLARHDGLRVGSAAGESALAALGLGQQGVDPVHHRVTFHAEADGGIAEHQADNCGECSEGDDCGQHLGRPVAALLSP